MNCYIQSNQIIFAFNISFQLLFRLTHDDSSSSLNLHQWWFWIKHRSRFHNSIFQPWSIQIFDNFSKLQKRKMRLDYRLMNVTASVSLTPGRPPAQAFKQYIKPPFNRLTTMGSKLVSPSNILQPGCEMPDPPLTPPQTNKVWYQLA